MLRRILFIWALCVAAASATADTLILANGDELTCEIVEWAVDHVVIDHPQLGRIHLSLDQLELDTGERPNPGLFGTGFMRGWSRRIDLGVRGEEGNSIGTTVTGGIKLSYTDDWTRWKIDGRYFYDRDEGGTSDNNARVDARRDWLFPDSRWFISSAMNYQFDRFESWRNRLTSLAGPGYHLVQRESHALDVIMGPAFTREFGESNANKIELYTGFDYSWKISKRQSFTLKNNFFLETSPDSGAIRNFTRAEWSVALFERPALSFNIGVDNEYESRPEGDDTTNDLNYFLTLGLDL